MHSIKVRSILAGVRWLARTRCVDTRAVRSFVCSSVASYRCDLRAAESAAWMSADLGRCRGRVVVREPGAARSFARKLSAYQCAAQGGAS